MVKVSFPYNEDMKEFVKKAGARWDKDSRTWDVPEESFPEVKDKAHELGLEIQSGAGVGTGAGGLPGRRYYQSEAGGRAPAGAVPGAAEREGAGASTGAPKEGTITLGKSRDGRYVLMSINLLAFTEDLQKLISGQTSRVRFRVLPPRPREGQRPPPGT